MDFSVKIVLWNIKPREYAKFYFLDNNSQELYKENTSFNNKSDNFWHSIYIISDIFKDGLKGVDDEVESQLFFDQNNNKLKNKIILEIKVKLIELRKPYLEKNSDLFLKELEQKQIIPPIGQFGIYDRESYLELIKKVYIISPETFNSKSETHQKFVCNTFAALMSSQETHLIELLINQLAELTPAEQDNFKTILEQTTLKNALKTLNEITTRLTVIEELKTLIVDFGKTAKEVIHIQKILDRHFWIFGEQFKLFSSTEGKISTVMKRYAKDILKIEDPVLETNSAKEVDLFLTKFEHSSGLQKNIIIELKRASIKLTEDVEYKQIKTYYNEIIKNGDCNSGGQYWEFYLIGRDYDEGIQGLINSNSNHGEKNRGLVHCDREGRSKIYVRKWSDILEVEWGNKMNFLKEKLEYQTKQEKVSNPDEITKNLVNL